MSILDTLESGIESVGQAVDAGFGSFASFLSSLGDGVANISGGAVDELELGETRDPKLLIRGEPSAVSSTAETLTGFAADIESTTEALGQISAGDWTGEAADEFDAEFRKQRQLWADAADAMATASRQISAWNSALAVAQAKAAHAVHVWHSAEMARHAYNALDAELRADVADTWTSQYAEARSILRDARAMRDQAADRVSEALDAATATAPAEPSLGQQWWYNLNDLGAVVDFGIERGKAGVIDAASSVIGLARTVNPTDPYNVTHPAEYVAGLSNLAEGAAYTATHPAETLQAAATDARSNPFGFAGGLSVDGALGAATGGASVGIRVAKGFDGPDGGHGEAPEVGVEPAPVALVEVQKFDAVDFRDAAYSEQHFDDHRKDFGSTSEAEYVAEARQFLRDAQANGYPARIDQYGRIRIYHPETNTFGAYETDGRIVTYFKPTPPTYWSRQKGNDLTWTD